MFKINKAFLLSMLSLAITSYAFANETHHNMNMVSQENQQNVDVIKATGVVKIIDFENKKITIAHGPIPKINWPAMTMRFTFTEPDSVIDSLKEEDAVDFSFIQQGNVSLLKEINVIHQ